MSQLVLNIENPKILPSLKKVLSALEGVSIAQTPKKSRKSGLDEALDDVREGRVFKAKDTDELFKKILGV